MLHLSLATSLAGILLASCATIEAPKGGPEDKTGPRVIAVWPPPRATEVPNTLDAQFQFSEWIVENPPQGAVLLSPPLSKRIRLEADGDLLRIKSDDTLRPATTYVLSVTPSLMDLHGNPLAPPFRLRFSTGTELDSFAVSGRALMPAGNKLQGAIAIALWPLDSLPADSIMDPLRTPPFYLGVADSLGDWRIEGMRGGHYRMLAFLDLDRNGRPSPTQEPAGIAETDLTVMDTAASAPLVQLGDLDTTSLSIEGASQRGPSLLEISFSRTIDRARADSIHCAIGPYAPDGGWIEPLAGSLILSFSKAPVDTLLEIHCTGAVDSLGRSLDTARARAKVRLETWKDSVATRMTWSDPPRGAKDRLPTSSALLAFNQPVDSLYYSRIRMVVGDSDTIATSIRQTDPVRVQIDQTEPLPAAAKVRLVLLPADTALRAARPEVLLQWETASQLKLTRLSGTIPGGDGHTQVELHNLETGTINRSNCLPSGSFQMDSLLAAPYLLRYYRDLNGNGRQDVGSLSPWTPPEPFRQPMDTLKLPRAVESDLNTLLPTLPTLP